MGHMRRARSLISRSFQLQDSFSKVRLAVFKIMHIVPRYKYRIAIYISMARLGTPGKVMCRSRYGWRKGINIVVPDTSRGELWTPSLKPEPAPRLARPEISRNAAMEQSGARPRLMGTPS